MAYLITWSVTSGFASLARPCSWCLTKDVESVLLVWLMPMTVRRSRNSFLKSLRRISASLTPVGQAMNMHQGWERN